MTNSTTIGVTLDCNDIVRLARFWSAALGYDEPVPASADVQFHGIVRPPGGTGLEYLTLQRVHEPRAAKNRAHLDLVVDDRSDEVDRLTALGATLLEEHDGHYATSVMADPEGNEFCVVQRPSSP